MSLKNFLLLHASSDPGTAFQMRYSTISPSGRSCPMVWTGAFLSRVLEWKSGPSIWWGKTRDRHSEL